jgi:hypothetical protein
MGDFVCTESNDSPSWGLLDLFAWKLIPERFGGSIAYIQRFKDAWVKHNSQTIRRAAAE